MVHAEHIAASLGKAPKKPGVLKDTNPDSLRTIVKQVKSRES